MTQEFYADIKYTQTESWSILNTDIFQWTENIETLLM